MSRDTPIPLQYSAYAAVRGIAGLVQAFPIQDCLETVGHVGTAYYKLHKRHRWQMHDALRRAYPEWDDDRIAETAMASLQHMMQIFVVDAVVMPRLVLPQTWPEHLRFAGFGRLLDALIRGEPMIMVTGHIGNWEMLGHALALFGFPITALARPVDNVFLNDWLLKIREARGTKILTKWGAIPEIDALLRSGGRLGVIADQDAGREGIFVPFFGRLAASYKSIALLAMSHRVPIATGRAHRCGPGIDYELAMDDFITPEEWEDQEDPVFYITARFVHSMEMMVRREPHQYLWIHRRWKNRPKFERHGKPFPERLKRKLMDLPWMTEAELERIVDQSAEDARRLAKGRSVSGGDVPN